MPLTLGLDVGTTSITALALDTAIGSVALRASTRADAEATSPADRGRGRSEWDADRLATQVFATLRRVADGLGDRRRDIAGLALTGAQHGGLVVDAALRPLTPYINWQDRRAADLAPDGETWLDGAKRRLGPAAERAGCALVPGFLGVSLYWLRENDALPADGTALFITDYLAARLTGGRLATDPTMAGGSGVFDVRARAWNDEAIAALDLPRTLFPAIAEAGDPLGGLSAAMTAVVGLPAGLPVYVGLGDHQAGYVGSVADRATTVFVNVGTGAQVARYSPDLHLAPPLENRPYPRGGNLLVNAGLFGGRVYALLEGFFRTVGRDLFDQADAASLYTAMNALAAAVPPGADGLRIEPYLSGSRVDPTRRGVISGVSDTNFTPAHLVRAFLEGMARSYREGYALIEAVLPEPPRHLVVAGNGLRENPLLRGMVADAFGLSLSLPAHAEEAAYGAALVAGVGAGVWPDIPTACRMIRYQEASPHAD